MNPTSSHAPCPLVPRRVMRMLVLGVSACAVAGCGGRGPQPAARGTADDPAAITVVDRLGRSVAFAGPARRIVSLSPSTTELLFALGAGGRVVGATSFCDHPAEATEIPRVGSGTLESISREAIVALEPDVVLCKWDNHQPLIEPLEKAGITCVAIGPDSLEQLCEEAVMLGRITGSEPAAAAFTRSMKERLRGLVARVARCRTGPPQRVFYEVWDAPLMSAGPSSFIGELLELAGLQNIVHDAAARYPRISDEVVVERNPDVILAPTTHFEVTDVAGIARRPGWGAVNAVRNGRVFLIQGDAVSRCGPRVLDALEEIIDVVHAAPERVAGDVPRPEGVP